MHEEEKRIFLHREKIATGRKENELWKKEADNE